MIFQRYLLYYYPLSQAAGAAATLGASVLLGFLILHFGF